MNRSRNLSKCKRKYERVNVSADKKTLMLNNTILKMQLFPSTLSRSILKAVKQKRSRSGTETLTREY